jgi:hypothetical protein
MHSSPVSSPTRTELVIQRLQELFPDSDPRFLAKIIPQYDGTESEVINRVSHKLLHAPYPTVLRLPSGAVDTRRTMNRDLILLHGVFPYTDVALLRQTIQRFTFGWAMWAADTFIDRPPPKDFNAAGRRLDRADLIRPSSYLDRLSKHLLDTFPSLSTSTLTALAIENRYEMASTMSACNAEMRRRRWFGKLLGAVQRAFTRNLKLSDLSNCTKFDGDKEAGEEEWRREWRVFTSSEVAQEEAEQSRLAKASILDCVQISIDIIHPSACQ